MKDHIMKDHIMKDHIMKDHIMKDHMKDQPMKGHRWAKITQYIKFFFFLYSTNFAVQNMSISKITY